MTEKKIENIIDQINEAFPAARACCNYGQPCVGDMSEIIDNIDGEPFMMPLVDYYEECHSLYPMGIHRDFAAWLDSHNLRAEFYDPGTVLIYED